MKLYNTMSIGCWIMILMAISGCGLDNEDPRYDAASLEGVWMSFNTSAGGSAFNNVRWIVFDREGYIIDDLPRMGFHGITESDLLNYTLGTYTVNGRSVEASTAYTRYTFDWTDINTLTREGYTYKFYRCEVKDNLRLNGSWTTYETTNHPWLDEAGARPVLTLNSDGTFTDRGLWITNFDYPNGVPENSPGNGTYQILDYTLILNYSDGRVKKRSITGAVSQNPEKNASVLYIGGNPVHKR